MTEFCSSRRSLIAISHRGRAAAATMLAAGAIVLAACSAPPPATPLGTTGTLFTTGLDDVAELYIEPISTRQVALAGLQRLSGLDAKIVVAENPGAGSAPVVALLYGGAQIVTYPIPPENDVVAWGRLIGMMIDAARRSSSTIAALPEDRIDRVVFDGITGALDRFSRYAPPELARDQRADREGFGGVGIIFDITSNRFRVDQIVPHSPAAAAGIRPDDEITAVDGIATAGRPEGEIVHRLRGPVDSRVALTVSRSGSTAPQQFDLRRATIVNPTVTMTQQDGIVVFRIASFNQSTARLIGENLAAARRQSEAPPRGIVLDMRGNPGGLLDQAVKLADLFIARGPIVSTRGRNPASKQYFAATGHDISPAIPVVVLINGGSASAAEIVAAALQDDGRAVVIGTASYGKGTVQTVLPLPNDGALILTWARLVTPSGYLLQSHGVVPTLCTSDLGDNDGALQIAVARARGLAPGATAAARPRAALDEQGWQTLRASCPPRPGHRDVDVRLAERVIADPGLYRAALGASAVMTGTAAHFRQAARPGPRALTAGRRGLSSGAPHS